MKLKAVATMLLIDIIVIMMTATLYFFFISTQTPKTADPMMPPMINTAPNNDASSLKITYLNVSYDRVVVFSSNVTNHCTQCVEYTLDESKYDNHEPHILILEEC